jgi:hypothetical protein
MIQPVLYTVVFLQRPAFARRTPCLGTNIRNARRACHDVSQFRCADWDS